MLSVERVLEMLDRSPAALAEITRSASDFIRENYSPQREEGDILDA